MSMKARPQMTAKVTMKVDPNQSSIEATVEHDLERAEEGRDQHEADEIEAEALLLHALAVLARRRGLPQDQGDQRHREEPDRAVDQKAPVP